MLEKKEKVLLKKVAAEVEKAKEFTRGKNKRGDVGLGFVLWDLNVFVKMKMKMVELLEVLEM